MVGESGGDRGDSGGGGGERARCVRCDLEYNRDDRCPRVLVCGHTCCSACLDQLITEGQKRCPTCSRQFFSLSVVLIPKNLEVLSGEDKSSKSSGSSQSSVSSYRSPFTSSSSRSSFEVTKSSEESSQSLKSSYSSPLRSSLSSNLEVPNSSEKSSLSLQTSESWKSSQSFKSSYTSTLRSYSSFDSSLERPAASTETSSVAPSLKSSSFFGSSLGVREDSEGSVRSDDVYESSSSVLPPPPVPSSAPPSLLEYNSDLLTSGVRPQGGKGASEVDGGGGQDFNSDGDRSGGGSGGGGSGTRPSTLNRSPSADDTSGGSYAPPTYSFPTIRTKLNINGMRKPENDTPSSSVSSGKAQLRPTKSLPPSSFPSSTSKTEDESPSSVPSSSGYTSPFLKSSTSSFSSSSSSSLRTNTFRSTYSEPQKLSSKDTAATDTAKETNGKTLSSTSPSPFRASTFRTLSSDAQKPSSRDTVATGSEKETKNKTLSSTSPSPFRTSTFRTMSSEANKLSSRNTVTTDSEKETKNKTHSSSPSPFRTRTFRTLSSEGNKLSSRNTVTTDSEKETKNKITTSSTYSSLSSSSLSSTNESSLSGSLPSLNKLETKLSVPPAAEKKDEVDLGVSRWKMQTPSSLSRKTDDKDASSLRTEGQNSASSSSKASGTPSHVLRMIRSVTTKTRYADDTTKVANKTDEPTTSLSSHREATTTTTTTTSSSFAASSSSSSSLLTTSKDSHTRHESGQFGQEGATTQQMSPNSAASDAPPAASVTPGGVSDWPRGSVSQLPSPDSDSGAGDATAGRGGVPVLGGEADEAARHVPAAAPPTGSRGEDSKGSRKLALSASLSARLGARTRFLAAAIDEASEEEEHAGGSESSVGERQARAGRGDKLYTPDRQGVQQQQQQQQQPAWSRVSLGARISARASYLSGGWGGAGGGASRGEVQAEDSTKIDLQRRAGRAGTKDEAAEEGRDGTPGEAHGAAGAHLATAGDDAARGVEAKPGAAGPTQSRRPSVLRDAGDSEGDGTPQGASTSGRRDPPGVRGSAAPTHESSQHTQWRRHRPIDSRAKEELSDAGCGPQAASDHSLGSTSTGLPQASEGGASTPTAQPDAGSTTAAATSTLRQNEADDAPYRHHHQPTKYNDTSDGTPSVFRSEAGSVTDTSRAAVGAAGTSMSHEGDKASTPPPLPSSGPYPWRKKWRSVTEHTPSAAARHTPPRANNTALSGTSKQPEQPPPPRSPPPPGEAPGRPSGSKGNITASYRASLGALAIGRVPSVQEPDGDGNKAARRGRAPDSSKTGSWQAAEDTSEDINTRLRQARERLRATTTTPTEEEPPPSPARTNLTYLLARVQSSEAMARTTKKTVLSDDDDEVFEDSEDEVEGDKQPKPPHTSPSDSLDGGLEANTLENYNPPTGSIQDTGRLYEATTDEVDSVTRRRNHHNHRKELQDSEERAQEELHDRTLSQNGEATRQSDLNSINQLQNGDATEQWEVNDTQQQQGLEDTRQTDQQDQDEAQDTDEDATDAPYEAPPGYYGAWEAEEGEYEPGVGLCTSHSLMLDRYCQDCEEWVCKDCLRVLHRPRPEGSCTVISAAEGVNQIKISHSSFLTSRSNTLEYFRAELRRIIEECNSSINLHKDNIRHLESKIEEERRLLRGIKSMKTLSKEKMKHVNYWEDILQDNLSRIDESSTSEDVLRAVQESSGDILQKAMEAVSLEASAGVLLSPPN